MTTTVRTFLTGLATLLVVTGFAVTTAGCTTAYSQEKTQAWSRAELEQLVAPVALYPDALLAQLLIAATYPDEIVEAARWSQMHPELAGEDAMRAADVFDWDPSVKSLLAFPGLLARMDEKLDWTRALGDAFLAQEEDVMDAVQGLRRRARIEGTLASDDHVRIVDDGPRTQIAFASPALVYVPYYDPRVVYGRWWWPAHPPVVWAPWPGYRFVPRAPGLHVGLWWNPGVRLSVGFFFGDIDWSRRQVQVVRVDPWYVHRAIERRAPQRVVVIQRGRWQHEPTRRHLDPRRVVHAPQPTPRIEVRRPDARRPETRQAEVRKPAPRTTEVHQADTRKPAPPKPIARQAEVRKSEPPKPVVRQAEVRGPAARTPERREAELRQPSVRKPEARTVEREQPRRNTRNERTPPRETPAAQREVQQPNAGTAQRAQGRPVARETRKNDQAVQREGRREVQRDEARPNAAPERKEQNADDARERQPRG